MKIPSFEGELMAWISPIQGIKEQQLRTTLVKASSSQELSVFHLLLPLPSWAPKVKWRSLAKAMRKATKYCLSFTAAGLKPELAAVIARTHGETGSWKQTRALVLERNALQTRSLSSGKRLESELRQRLQLLSQPQLELLAEGSSNDRLAMAWLAVLKRIQLTVELTRDLLLNKLECSDALLRRSDMTGFYETAERLHPELQALSDSSQKRVRSTVLAMLREAGLLEGKANRSGQLGTVQRPSLSPQALALLGDDPDLRAGFLLKPKQRRAKR